MRSADGIVIAVLVLAAAARGDEVDNIKLQGALRLPTIPVMFQYDAYGLSMMDVKPDPEKQIDELHQALTSVPDDAEGFALRGRLYRDLGDDTASQNAYAQAVELFRKRVEAEPAKAERLLDLGNALKFARQWDEADRVLHQAVRLAPESWQAWTDLGWVLNEKANVTLFGGPEKYRGKWVWGDISKRALDGEFTVDAAEKAVPFLNEAARCFDRAIAVAPKQPEPYSERADFRFWELELRWSLDHTRDQKCGQPSTPVTPACLADMRQAVALGLKTPHDLIRAASYELLAGTAANGPPAPGGGPRQLALPDENRKQVQNIVTVLQQVAGDRDSQKAAAALSTLSVLQLSVLHELDAAEKTIHRLLALQPNNETAWDMLLNVMAEHDDEEKCLKVCLERLEHCDSAHGRLLLAKGYVRLGQFDPAEEHYRAAVKMAPQDFLANLSLATILLKRAHDRDSFQEAFAQIERTGKLGPEGIGEEYKMHYAAVVGVAKVISGEEEEGRRILESVLFQDPEHKLASEALEILKK